MLEDFTMCPFVRLHVGQRGEFLTRTHPGHTETSARAIRRRGPAPWSTSEAEIRFGAAA